MCIRNNCVNSSIPNCACTLWMAPENKLERNGGISSLPLLVLVLEDDTIINNESSWETCCCSSQEQGSIQQPQPPGSESNASLETGCRSWIASPLSFLRWTIGLMDSFSFSLSCGKECPCCLFSLVVLRCCFCCCCCFSLATTSKASCCWWWWWWWHASQRADSDKCDSSSQVSSSEVHPFRPTKYSTIPLFVRLPSIASTSQ